MEPYESEQKWIDIWNDLIDLDADGLTFVNGESFTWLSLEDAKKFVQDTIYSGYDVTLEDGWYKGKKAVVLRKGDILDSSDV